MADTHPDLPPDPPPAKLSADPSADSAAGLPVPASGRRRLAMARVVKSRPLSRTRPPVPPAPPARPRRRENPVRRWFRHRMEFVRAELVVYRRVAQLVIAAAVVVGGAILVYPRLLVLLVKMFGG
jgi:hypothetical protein